MLRKFMFLLLLWNIVPFGNKDAYASDDGMVVYGDRITAGGPLSSLEFWYLVEEAKKPTYWHDEILWYDIPLPEDGEEEDDELCSDIESQIYEKFRELGEWAEDFEQSENTRAAWHMAKMGVWMAQGKLNEGSIDFIRNQINNMSIEEQHFWGGYADRLQEIKELTEKLQDCLTSTPNSITSLGE